MTDKAREEFDRIWQYECNMRIGTPAYGKMFRAWQHQQSIIDAQAKEIDKFHAANKSHTMSGGIDNHCTKCGQIAELLDVECMHETIDLRWR